MVSLKEAMDKPRSPPSHVYFSVKGEEILSNEWIDIKFEKDGLIIKKNSSTYGYSL